MVLIFLKKDLKMNFSADFIRHKLNGELPGLSSHLKLAPDSRAEQIASYKESKRQAKKSAVMILLFHENEKLKVIFIRRGMYVGIHAGQIAFPGGRFEDSDVTVENTAFREIEEEIGVTRDKIELLGQLTDIYVPPSNFLISIFVGYLSERPQYKPDEREVAEIIELDFENFLVENVISEKDFQVPSTTESVRALYYKLPNADLWGASAMVMTELIDVLNAE